MKTNEEIVELFHDTWVSYFELEAEELNVENSLSRLDDANEYLEPETDQESFEAEEAEFYIDRFVEQAEEFADNLVELAGTVGVIGPDYVASEDVIVPYKDDSLPEEFDVQVKSFQYDPNNLDPSEARVMRGVANLMDRYDRMRERVEEHYEPQLGEGLTSIVSELDSLEDSGRKVGAQRVH